MRMESVLWKDLLLAERDMEMFIILASLILQVYCAPIRSYFSARSTAVLGSYCSEAALGLKISKRQPVGYIPSSSKMC